MLLTNPLGFTQKLNGGIRIGHATGVTVVTDSSEDVGQPLSENLPKDTKSEGAGTEPIHINAVWTDDVASRKHKLSTMIAELAPGLQWQDRASLLSLLLDHHFTFAVEDGERGETDVVQMTIDTGDHPPKKQAVRRVPFAVRQEVSQQLRKMQQEGVVKPSSSPWASPVVLVRKKDSTLRFCFDYRHLNSITKADTFPLPRIDDLLDQLGKAKSFTTLDLAAGYWQVRVHPDAQEKTAFITQQGLYEFSVMPFGLRNAPAVFQRLMQRVLVRCRPRFCVRLSG